MHIDGDDEKFDDDLVPDAHRNFACAPDPRLPVRVGVMLEEHLRHLREPILRIQTRSEGGGRGGIEGMPAQRG